MHVLYRDAIFVIVPAGLRNTIQTAIALTERGRTEAGPSLVVAGNSAELRVVSSVLPRALKGDVAA